MMPISASPSRALNLGSLVTAADNSGALIVKIVSVKRGKVTRKTQQYAKIADWVKVSVRKGVPEMKGKVFDAVVVRVRKPYKRNTGERIAFADNAVVIIKDDKANPKGTQVKGPVAKEVHERWPNVSKLAKFVL